MTHLNLLGGGPVANWPKALKEHQVDGDWIGVDRGTLRLIKLGIDPIYAIGDFDSMNSAELALVKQHVSEIHQSNPEKDDTDTQLGLKVALQRFAADSIDIYGVTGGRLDHFLANFFMVLEMRFRPFAQRIRLIDAQNTISYFLPGTHEIKKEPGKRYLAFVPLTKMTLTLADERYQLNQYPIQNPVSLASNEFVGETGHFTFDQGVIAVIQSCDQ
ncbi:thiamine diphosphokinase [Nicoliella spurrieriana]|uniref:Thiamine diphosphokinase n=1 Tax=Nicoliella spurrieriana TaxID=2925830 RepID=A0A976X5G3_9LACO|nr:thiamine diphosphokinase [Nicoliella spurrieriana]UQS86639.1 thiamine diphosphokinase [Nicoliella spurrieriana]